MRLHPAAALIVSAVFVAASFILGPMANTSAGVILLAYLLRHDRARVVLRRFAIHIGLALLFVFALNGVLYPESHVAVGPFRFLKKEGILFAWRVSARMVVLLLSQILFLTSAEPHCLAEIFMRKTSTRPIGYAFLFTVSMMRSLRQKLHAVADAQRARGLKLGGGLWDRMRAVLPIFGPVVFSYLKESIDRSMALSLSGLGLQTPYTPMGVEAMTRRDKVVAGMALAALIIATGVKILI